MPDLVGRPLHVTILEQGYEIVGQRPLNRILEVEYPWVVDRRLHEVARVVVAMHKDLRLVERVRDQQVAAVLPGTFQLVVKRNSEVRAAQPVME